MVWEVIAPTKVIWEARLGCGRSSTQQPTFGAGKIRCLWNKTGPTTQNQQPSFDSFRPLPHWRMGRFHIFRWRNSQKTKKLNLRRFGPTTHVSLELTVELFGRLLGSGVARHQPFAHSIEGWMSWGLRDWWEIKDKPSALCHIVPFFGTPSPCPWIWPSVLQPHPSLAILCMPWCSRVLTEHRSLQNVKHNNLPQQIRVVDVQRVGTTYSRIAGVLPSIAQSMRTKSQWTAKWNVFN